MANPQIKNGYTRIANELLEAICRLNISGNEMRILLYIIRRTYGFNKSYAEVPLSDISEALGMKKGNVSRGIKKLREANIVDHRPNKGTTPQTVSINKNYDEWAVESCTDLLLSNSITVINSDNPKGYQFGNPTVINSDNPKGCQNDNHTYKENIKDSIKERGERKTLPSSHVGQNRSAFVNDDNYNQLVSEYGADVIDKYISRVDDWAFKKGKNIGESSETIRRWLEEDNVQKLDPDIKNYEKFINQFLPL